MIFFLISLLVYSSVLLFMKAQPASLRDPLPSLKEHFNSIRITLFTGIMLLCIFFFTSNFEFITINEGVRVLLGLSNIGEFSHLWPFQTITALFIHYNVEHLLGNVVMLGLLSAYERRVGAKRFIMVLTIGALASVPSILFYQESVITCGISGGLFALAIAYFTDYDDITAKEWFTAVGVFILLNIFLNFYSGQSHSMVQENSLQIDHIGHILGALSAMIYCRLSKQKRSGSGSLTISFVAFFATVAVVISLVGMHLSGDTLSITGEMVSLENENSLYYEGFQREEIQPYIDTLRAFGFLKDNYDLELKIQRDTTGVSYLFNAEESRWDDPAITGYYLTLFRKFLIASPEKKQRVFLFDSSEKNKREISYDVTSLSWLNPALTLTAQESLISQLNYWKNFFQYAVDNDFENVDWIGIPTPFNIASNGMALIRPSMLNDDWKALFGTGDEYEEAYRELGRAFSNCSWVSNENIFLSYCSVFEQLAEHISLDE